MMNFDQPQDRNTVRKDDAQFARWRDESRFEEEIRSVMQMLRPHRSERLAGWEEYSAKGEHFRVTVSWENGTPNADNSPFQIPDIADVLESLLVGSVRSQDEMDAKEEFELYAMIVNDLSERVKELRARYD